MNSDPFLFNLQKARHTYLGFQLPTYLDAFIYFIDSTYLKLDGFTVNYLGIGSYLINWPVSKCLLLACLGGLLFLRFLVLCIIQYLQFLLPKIMLMPLYS